MYVPSGFANLSFSTTGLTFDGTDEYQAQYPDRRYVRPLVTGIVVAVPAMPFAWVNGHRLSPVAASQTRTCAPW